MNTYLRYKRFKQIKRFSDWNNYQQSARVSRKACTDAYNDFIHHSTEDNNKKKVFSIVKTKRASLKSNGTTYIKDGDIARILNSEFTSVFSDDDGSIPTRANLKPHH